MPISLRQFAVLFCIICGGCATSRAPAPATTLPVTRAAQPAPANDRLASTNNAEPSGASIGRPEHATLGGLAHSLFVELPRFIYDQLSGNTPINMALGMENREFAEVRRKSVNKLVARPFGQHEPYTKRYAQLASLDADPIVRATAIRALNRVRFESGRPIFIKALGDESVLVRLEAAKALANLPDPSAAQPLINRVADPAEDKDVRIAAADALRHYHTVDAARALAARLGEREFGVAWQSRQSLRRMTGQDHRYDEAAWLSYLSGPGKPLG